MVLLKNLRRGMQAVAGAVLLTPGVLPAAYGVYRWLSSSSPAGALGGDELQLLLQARPKRSFPNRDNREFRFHGFRPFREPRQARIRAQVSPR